MFLSIYSMHAAKRIHSSETAQLEHIVVCMYVCMYWAWDCPPGVIVTLFITISATLFGADTCLRVYSRMRMHM
jgi:hypothetical protein